MTTTSLPGSGTTSGLRDVPGSRKRVTINAAQSLHARLAAASVDMREALALWRLVWKLSLLDIRLRYRGSVLGPFWLTLSTGVMVGALGVLYAGLFHLDIKTYLPYLALSLILWNFLSAMTAEGCTCFTAAEAMIRANRMPFSLHAGRVVIRNFLVFAHNIVIVAVVFAVMGKMPGAKSYLVLPGLALWFVDGMAACLLLGAFCARFRDIPPIITSVMQIAFFMTPVIWSPTILEHRHIGVWLIDLNPFYALLEIVRGPLDGTPVHLAIWGFAFGCSGVLVLLAGVFFALARPRLAYWV